MSDPAFAWSVELPARGARSSVPRASLSISSTDHGDERLRVPVAVGRALERPSQEASGPACRAELLYRLGEETVC